jgi:predicted ATPase
LLVARIARGQVVLVLDNCEHLPNVGETVAELLRACPELSILATSRAPLLVSGEQEFPVSPLPLPGPRQVEHIASLADNPAVALFVDRARQVRPDFQLTADNAATVAVICRKLDGLPLAIELAAARTRALPPRVLLERLGDVVGGGALRLLANGARDLPERHHTLDATIDWSYSLLPVLEQALFRRLAVFAGGCTLAAAEAICGGDLVGSEAPPIPRHDVLGALITLVDNSLVLQTSGVDGEPRYQMLETIREFAWKQLVCAGEDAAMRERHARHYLALVEQTGALLFAAPATRDRLAAEDGNVQAALRWLVKRD